MLLQMEHEKLKHQDEVEKQLALEKMKCEMEQARITLELKILGLIRDGRLSLDAAQWLGENRLSSGDCSSSHLDLVGNFRLIPRFNERDPEMFYFLFERVADTRGWPDSDCTLTCVLTGKAQEAYSALSMTDSLSYASVNAVVLKVYEMVPEAYREGLVMVRKRINSSSFSFHAIC